jgi:PEP-CTERM motif-containing protein
LVLLAPSANADIFKIEGPASCPGNIGSGLCNGNVPFSLTGFLNGSVTFNVNVPVLGGTEEWVLINDTGNPLTSFSFLFSGSQANNASCQIANSHGATLTNASNFCSIVDSLGHTTSLGGTQIGGGGQFFTPLATITFGGLGIAAGSSFNLDFVSMQGTGTTSVPEPSTLLLLGSGAVGLIGVIRRKLRA